MERIKKMKRSFIVAIGFLVCIAASLVLIFGMSANKPHGVVTLMYHDFGYSGDPSIISAEVFEDQLAALKKSGYTALTMQEYVDYMNGKLDISERSVLITFDDGYLDFYEIAYPILQKYDYPATNFVIVKSSNEHNPKQLPHLTWDQMREMQRNGMSFYSHTYDHHKMIDKDGKRVPKLANAMVGETTEQYRDRVREDLVLAHQLLVQELGERDNILAFPYGAFSDDLLKVMNEIGIKHYFTIRPGLNERGTIPYYRVNAGLSALSGDKLIQLIEKQY